MKTNEFHWKWNNKKKLGSENLKVGLKFNNVKQVNVSRWIFGLKHNMFHCKLAHM